MRAAETVAIEPGGVDEERDRSARAGEPVPHAFIDRQHRFLPGQRLADDG